MNPTDPPARKRKLLDRMRDALRVRHLAPSTEEAYIRWVRRFILYNDKRHPQELGKREVEALLTYLAAEDVWQEIRSVVRRQ